MLEWLKSNWGNLASVAGLVATVVGLAYAIVQVRRTKAAAEAAREAAEEAAQATQTALSRAFTIGDLKNTIALIEKVKSYHRENKWETAIEWYQPVRSALADARARYPGLKPEQLKLINAGILQLVEMGNIVGQAIRIGDLPPANAKRITDNLNAVQSSLESLVSELQMSSNGPRG